MINFDLDSNTHVDVDFRHHHIDQGDAAVLAVKGFTARPGDTLTVAKVKTTQTGCQSVEIDTYTGIARCVACDNFNKNVGRKIALRRALAALPRDVRGKIWRAYFDKRGPTAAK